MRPMSTQLILWTLRSIARLERKGDLRSPRLTEPGLKKWHRIGDKTNGPRSARATPE